MDMPTTPIERRIITPQQKLEWGKFFHETDMGRQQCAEHLSVSPSQLDNYVRAYRFANGFETPNNPPNSTDQHALDILARADGKKGKHRPETRKPKQAGATAAQLVPVATPDDTGTDTLAKLRTRIADLESQLTRALDEAHTLQKIVMVLGDRL
jgi:transposase-like protein